MFTRPIKYCEISRWERWTERGSEQQYVATCLLLLCYRLAVGDRPATAGRTCNHGDRRTATAEHLPRRRTMPALVSRTRPNSSHTNHRLIMSSVCISFLITTSFTRTEFAKRAFWCSAPTACDSPPSLDTNSDSLTTFKSRSLKT